MKICQMNYNLNYFALKFLYILGFVSSFMVVFFTAVLFKDQFTSLTMSSFFAVDIACRFSSYSSGSP